VNSVLHPSLGSRAARHAHRRETAASRPRTGGLSGAHTEAVRELDTATERAQLRSFAVEMPDGNGGMSGRDVQADPDRCSTSKQPRPGQDGPDDCGAGTHYADLVEKSNSVARGFRELGCGIQVATLARLRRPGAAAVRCARLVAVEVMLTPRTGLLAIAQRQRVESIIVDRDSSPAVLEIATASGVRRSSSAAAICPERPPPPLVSPGGSCTVTRRLTY